VARNNFDAERHRGSPGVPFVFLEGDRFAWNFVDGETPEETRDRDKEFTLGYQYSGADATSMGNMGVINEMV
jgi:hypothetical protein